VLTIVSGVYARRQVLRYRDQHGAADDAESGAESSRSTSDVPVTGAESA
jgi:hypothetical protein